LDNVFCANLAHSAVVLGAAHGSYGVGGIIAPIIATVMVSNGILWSHFFLITIGLRVVCFAFAGWAFKDFEKEGINGYTNSLRNPASRNPHNNNTDTSASALTLLRRALSNRTTLIGALFVFSYQGAEVSESGWFISYLIDYRSGDPSRVGYVTAGFWAGITLGRVTLTHLASRIGEKRFVAALTIDVIVFQLLAWFIPNVIGGAVAVSFLRFLLGPAYPCAMAVFARLLPAEIQMSAIAFITTAGSSGGAVVPFTTGILAQAFGAWVLHPVCVGFFVMMFGC
jgi:fucose permease